MSGYAPDEATAHEDMCRFLSACFYEPVPAFAEEGLFNSIITAASRIDAALAAEARKLREDFEEQDLQALLVDYSRLFLGPAKPLAQPYASCWLTTPKSSGTSDASTVLDMYNAVGFELDDEFRELPDHVAVELEFLYLLTFNRNDAQGSGQADEANALLQLERAFLAGHLGTWIAPFSAAVQAGAQTRFYRQLARVTEQFVLIEAATLDRLH